MSVEIVYGSVEYLNITVTSDIVMGSQEVDIALVTPGNRPLATDWQTGEWVGTSGTTRTCRLLVGPPPGSVDYAVGNYQAFVKVVDNPEVPIIDAGLVAFV